MPESLDMSQAVGVGMGVAVGMVVLVAMSFGIGVAVGTAVFIAKGLGVNVEQPVSRPTIIRISTPELNNLCLIIIHPSDNLSRLGTKRMDTAAG